MNKESVEERVIRVIGDAVDNFEVKADSSFEEMEFDSLDALDVLFDVEEEFDIKIPNEAAKEIRTIRDVITGVERILAGDIPTEASE